MRTAVTNGWLPALESTRVGLSLISSGSIARGLTVHKLRTTPADQSQAILAGLETLGADEAADVVHGSTVATNAVLERKGARVALFATAGFEDVLHIGRQTRPELYNIFVPLPRPIVDASLTAGITERLDAEGRVLTPIDLSQLDSIAGRSAGARR